MKTLTCLELLATSLTFKGDSKPGCPAAAYNFTKAPYKNHQGQTKSLVGLGLAANLRNFFHNNNTLPRVVHIPGNEELTANALSQKIINYSDWRIHPEAFQLFYT